jgi:hypothetical protein
MQRFRSRRISLPEFNYTLHPSVIPPSRRRGLKNLGKIAIAHLERTAVTTLRKTVKWLREHLPPTVSCFIADSKSGVNPDFRVNCVGCTTAGQILVKAVFDVDTNLPDFGDGGESGGKFFDLVVLDTAMLEVEIADDLKARANIEMFAGASSTISFTQRILPLPVTISPFQIGALLSIGPIFDFEVAMDITGPSASVNFTYGAELVVPKGAKATLDYGKSNKTGASGW